MEHEMISVKRELIKSDDDGSDGEPKLEIADHQIEPNQDAVESLLLLGKQAVVQNSPEIQRQRAASMSSETLDLNSPILTLSRRHSLETSAKIGHDKGAVVSYYQRMRERNNEASKRCRLKRRMKAVSMENQASMLNMANKMLKQRIQRLENVGAALKEGVKKIQSGQCACDLTSGIVRQTSRDYFDPDPNSGKDLPSYEVISKSKSIRENDGINYSNNGASSESEDIIMTNTPSSPIPKVEFPRNFRTALDVINETIVKTLDTPLNLVKNSTEIKVESPPEVDSSTPVCIANANGASLCRGEMLNLHKMTAYLDLVTRKVVKDDGASAMERAIIKSRLKIPFWSADETVMFICGAHRASVVHGADLTSCTMCKRRKSAKKARMMPINMYTITYSMSLEHYTRTGTILPIGLAVCNVCREKHLKSVDLSSSKMIDFGEGNVEENRPKIRQLSTTSNSSSVSSTNGEIQIVISPTTNHMTDVKTVVPVSSSTGNHIFAKIGRLNEALQAINPRYQPIGFSITSMDSCSPSVLQDAISAAETGVYTLLSVIAPGQESQLWETIRPILDKRLLNNRSK